MAIGLDVPRGSSEVSRKVLNAMSEEGVQPVLYGSGGFHRFSFQNCFLLCNSNYVVERYIIKENMIRTLPFLSEY